MAASLQIQIHNPDSRNPWVFLNRVNKADDKQSGLKIDTKGVRWIKPTGTKKTPLPWNVFMRLFYESRKEGYPSRLKKTVSVRSISVDMGGTLVRKNEPVVYIAAREAKVKKGRITFGNVIFTIGVTRSKVMLAAKDYDIDTSEEFSWPQIRKELINKQRLHDQGKKHGTLNLKPKQ